MIDAVVVLQARMASTRLPGKTLMPLGPHSLLAHCIRRLLAAGVGPVVVATTLRPDDDAIETEAERLGCAVVRGPTDDVLSRFVMAAAAVPSRWLIRATADNPAVDIESAPRLLRLMEACGAEYGVEEGHPVGGAVEVMASDTLRRVAAMAVTPYDREHVTTFVRSHPEIFRVITPDVPESVRRPDVRLTVDTDDDYQFMRRVLERVESGAGLVPLPTVIAAADRLRRRCAGEPV